MYWSYTPQQKKAIILKKIVDGDKRSYNQISADLELAIWTEKHKGPSYSKKAA